MSNWRQINKRTIHSKVIYAVNDYDMENGFPVSLPRPIDFRNSACVDLALKYIAEDYHENRNGDDGCWPMLFVVWSEDGLDILGEFQIDRELVPVFSVNWV